MTEIIGLFGEHALKSEHPFCAVTSDGEIQFVNDAMSERLGFTRDELVGRAAWEVDPYCSSAGFPDAWNRLRERGQLRYETEHVHADGAAHPVRVSATFHEGEQDLACATCVDISAERDIKKERLADLKATNETRARWRLLTGEEKSLLVALEEHKTIRRTAEHLNMGAATLHRRIKDIRSKLGMHDTTVAGNIDLTGLAQTMRSRVSAGWIVAVTAALAIAAGAAVVTVPGLVWESQRGEERQTSIAELSPGAWHDLIDREPEMLDWTESEASSFDIHYDKQRIDISTDATAVVGLGELSSGYGQFFQVDIRQLDWPGKTGVFFAYRERESDKLRAGGYQIVREAEFETIEITKSGSRFALQRKHHIADITQDGTFWYKTTGISAQFVDKPLGRQSLELEFGPKGLLSVSWGGKKIDRLAEHESDCSGRFGLFTHMTASMYFRPECLFLTEEFRHVAFDFLPTTRRHRSGQWRRSSDHHRVRESPYSHLRMVYNSGSPAPDPLPDEPPTGAESESNPGENFSITLSGAECSENSPYPENEAVIWATFGSGPTERASVDFKGECGALDGAARDRDRCGRQRLRIP